MVVELPFTNGQKDAVMAGKKEAKLIIEDAIGTIKQNMARLSNLIDLEMEKYNELEKGFRDIEDTSETFRGNSMKQYQKLASDYERLKKESEGLRQELARKR
jgi:predicted  nucleic acid-binding Zn-ribbon protein